MVVGHTGNPGASALWHVVVEFKQGGGHVPILLHDGVTVLAKETILSPKHVTQTIVEVRIAIKP